MRIKTSLALFFLASTLSINAQTDIGGTLSKDSTLTLAGSPYTVISNLGVPTGYTLTIEAGVEINLNDDYQIIIEGNIIANGNSGNRITLNGDTAGSAMILFRETNLSNSSLSYVSVNGPKDGIKLSNHLSDNNSGTLVIDHLTITKSKVETNGFDSDAEIWINNSTLDSTNVYGDSLNSETIRINNSTLIDGQVASYISNKGIYLSHCTSAGTSFISDCSGSIINIHQSTIDSANFIQSDYLSDQNDFYLAIDSSQLNNSIINMPLGIVNISSSDFIYDSEYSFSSCLVSGIGTIDRSDFTGNGSLIAIERGPGIQDYQNGDPYTITYCTFTGFGTNIKINAGTESGCGDGPVTINYCKFNDTPANYMVHNNSPYDVLATYNWWGTTTVGTINSMIYDMWDDIVYGEVNYSDYLSGANDPITLTVSTNALNIDGEEGSTASFDILSTISWSVSSDQTWLTVNPSSGSDTVAITLTASVNPGEVSRYASVTVSAIGMPSQTIVVTQLPLSTLSVSTNSLTVAALEGSTGTFNITSNTNWSVSSNQSWLAVNPSSGLNNATVTVTAYANTIAIPRTASVTVSSDGLTPIIITVSQDGANPDFGISPSTLSLDYPENSSTIAFVFSNANWTITSNNSWLTVNPSSGSLNDTLTVTASANPYSNARNGTLTVSCGGMTPFDVPVTQAAAPAKLALSITTLNIPYTFNVSSVDILSNTSWNLSSNESWLTLGSTSGSDSATVTLTASENIVIAPRTARVIVSGSSVPSDTLIVTQAAAPAFLNLPETSLNLPYTVSSNATFEIFSNTSWSVSSNQAWLTLNPGSGSDTATINLTASENTVAIIRNALVIITGNGITGDTIFVTQYAAPAALTVSANTLNIGYSANSTAAFNITSNTSWTVSSNQTWLTTNAAAGSNNATINLTAAANPAITTRNATITISGIGITPVTIQVTQAAAPAALNVSTPNLNVGYAANSTASFSIASNISWNISSNQTWLTLSSAAGANNSTITITAQENTATSIRTATISVSGSGVTTKTVVVTQAAALTTMSVSTNEINIPYTAGNTSFDINSNTSWTVNSDQTWLTLGSSSGSNNATIILTAQRNANAFPRVASVTISGNGFGSEIIHVTQAGAPASLTISTTILNVSYAANSVGTFNITTNTSWEITCDQDWLSFSDTSGTNNAFITVTASENTDTVSRLAIITISGEGVDDKTILVNQTSALTALPELSSIDIMLYPVPVNDILFISFTESVSEADIAIYSINGMRVYYSKIYDEFYEVDMSSYSPGLYLIEIAAKDKIILSRQIVKMH